jgi:acetylornithine deacetylase
MIVKPTLVRQRHRNPVARGELYPHGSTRTISIADREARAMDALAYAKELIRRPSTSAQSNATISDYVEETLRSLGFETERIEYDDPRGVRKVNVLGRKGAGTGGVGFFGHTDTVPADDWALGDPCAPIEKDGRLYGRGSCDMKGPVACALAAAAQFAAADLKAPIYICCTADEEVNYGGAKQVAARSQMFPEACSGVGIITEPTQLEVVYAHKGTIGIHATSIGRSAHSSTNAGLNANLAMIPFLAEMKRIHDELQTDPRYRNEEFDPPTPGWNIGINDHTRAVNITAPQSICTVYVRPMPGTDTETLLRRVRDCAQANGLQLEIYQSGAPLYTDRNSPLVRDALRLAGRTEPHTVAYGTDGMIFGQHLPMVVLGPGNIAQAHTADEWIALDQLEQGTALYAALIRHYCG